MKLKRLLSCALALALALTMTALPAAAVTFPDITKHWAKTDIEKMVDKGMFKGYEDGKFKPDNLLTTAEALAFCARIVPVDATISAKIATDRKSDMDAILKGDQSWFYTEFAICLETGILSRSELQSLVQGGSLAKGVAKEDLARYMVRALQLGPMAERLSAYSMSFTDVNSISASNQPYVYLLNIYGIVKGDENNKFLPKSNVSRAVMATMLSRSLDFITDRGITVDLPNYTTYDWKAGTIAATSSGDKGVMLLTLTNDLTGQTFATLSVPSDIKVYENNMLSTTAALKVGRHVRVSLTSGGTPTEIRVSGSVEAFDGKVSGIDGRSIALTVNGVGKMVTMDRFTQVQVGSSSSSIGNYTLVDANAGYTNAACQVDDQGRLVAVRLTGGTREESGLFQSAEKGAGNLAASTIIRVSGFDGVTRQYTAPSTATILINGVAGTLTSSQAGSFISLRVSNEDNTVVTATADTVTKYVQGAVKGTSISSTPNTVTISNFSTGKSVSYNVPSGATITYNNEEVAMKDIQKDYFVTIRLSGSEVARMDAYPGSTVTEGVITNRTFGTGDGTTATLEVTKDDKTVVNFTVSLSSPPDIKRSGATSTVDKLRLGDKVSITVRYNTVTAIDATPQSANVVGTINRIVQETGGSTLDLTLTDGTNVSYTVSASTEITQGGKDVTMAALKPGYRLAMVVSGDQIASIEIQSAAAVDGQISGTVIYVNTSSKEILLRVVDAGGNEQLVTVNAKNATVMGWDGSSVYLRNIEVGNTLQVNGAYDGATFVAKLILKY
ncbi:MAG: S-layer homology domain-containing protein [Clostridia bacterium]|nr:S-layer homology domain-containing protein [Clostridia bacterium]